MTILRVEHLSKSYGGLKVTDDVSFTLTPGERLAIIGPNGAGKTTLVSQIAGALQPDNGQIFLANDNVTAWPGYRRVGHGLVRTFQISKLAPDIPVIDQLALAIHQRDGSIGNMWRHKDSYGAVLDEAAKILRDLGLSRAELRTPSEMAYGDQRLVEVALALALKPRVLLLDEPMAGVPKSEAQLILDALERLPADLAVVIIEHDMELVFRFAHRILVLANGAVLADGAPADIRGNEVVRAVYLGKGGTRMNKLLEFAKVEAGYGPLKVLHGVSLDIHAGERVCLLGRNGVGKSTTLKTIMGLTDRRSGTLSWNGADITRSSTVARSRLGIGYVPQTRDVFPSLSVEENLIAGLRNRPTREIDRAYQLFPRLHERRNNGGTELSGGEQQMLSVARTLLGRPQLLLLDEPLEGLAPIICEELMQAFDTLSRDEGVAILFVEQKVQEALHFAQRAVVLDHGAVVHEGPSSELLADPSIVDRHVAVAHVPA